MPASAPNDSHHLGANCQGASSHETGWHGARSSLLGVTPIKKTGKRGSPELITFWLLPDGSPSSSLQLSLQLDHQIRRLLRSGNPVLFHIDASLRHACPLCLIIARCRRRLILVTKGVWDKENPFVCSKAAVEMVKKKSKKIGKGGNRTRVQRVQ